MWTNKICWFLLCACLGLSLQVHASLVLLGTRVIFNGEEKEATVRVLNQGQRPELMQVWVDSGTDGENSLNTKAPFLVTPPVSRIEAGQGQMLRIVPTSKLPSDRESVFWLNVLGVPPKDKSKGDSSKLELAFVTKIKLFYRPAGLNESLGQAVEQLRWQVISSKMDKLKVEVTNPSRLHITLINVKQGKKDAKSVEVGMLPPKGALTFDLHYSADSAEVQQIPLHYQYIDDFGVSVNKRSVIHF